MTSLVEMLLQPETLAACFAALAMLLALLLWHNMQLLADERERTREANKVVSLFEDVGGFQRAERGLRAAIEGLPDAFVLYDPEDRLVLFNSRYREIYADSADVIRVGNRFEDMLRIGVERGQYEAAKADPEAWIQERLAKHRMPPKVPIEQHLGDGRWLRVYEKRLADGHTVGFRIDITELKHREEALRLSEGRLAAVVRGALDAIVAVSPDGNIIEFNPAAERVFGYARADAMGRSARELLVPARHHPAYDERIARVLSCGPAGCEASGDGGGEGERIEARSLRADGSEILTEITFNCVEGHDGPMVIGFLRDITEERARTVALKEALARAEATDRAKSDFLAMMSHEIRTPLNAMIGLLDLMLEAGLVDCQRARAETARGSAEALLQIVNDILDYSRLETRRIEFVEVPFDPRELVRGVADLLSARAQAKGLELELEINTGVPAVLVGDAGRLRQILINLVSNAVKFTDKGRVRLCLCLRGTQPPAERGPMGKRLWPICICVKDTGRGIPPEERELVFERFRTLATPDGRRGEGVGLGLAICRELAEGMGGKLLLSEMEGGGSRFSVELDLAEGEAAALRVTQDQLSPDEEQVLKGAFVLVADDAATNRMLAESVLARWGCRVRSVHDGQEAVAALESGRFDAVLMDVSMPVMGGCEATRHVRAGNGQNRHVPIIALTAHADTRERDRALASGMDAFLTKPVDGLALARVLVAQLGRSKASQPALADAAQGQQPGEAAIDRARYDLTMDDVPAERRAAIVSRCVADLRAQAEFLRSGGLDAARLVGTAHKLGGLADTFGATRLGLRSRLVERSGGGGAEAAPLALELARLADDAADALAAIAEAPPLPGLTRPVGEPALTLPDRS